MGRVDEYHSGYLVAIEAGVDPHIVATKRVANQDIGPRRLRSLQESMQLSGDLKARTGLRTRITLPIAGPIVRADPGELRNTGLDAVPTERRLAKAGIQNHGGAAGACAVNVETVAADVHHPASDGEPARIGYPADRLIHHPTGERDQRHNHEGEDNLAKSPPQVRA